LGDGNLTDVVSRLGTVKNPVLVSSSMFSSGMLWIGQGLVENPLLIPALTGAGMIVLSVVVFLSGVGFTPMPSCGCPPRRRSACS